MMPIFALPGEMTPGQLGPMSRVLECCGERLPTTLTMSRTGMPSVMQTTRGMPAAVASRMPSAAAGGGTKMTVALAPVAAQRLLRTVLKTGQPSWVVPPLPGVTPPTTMSLPNCLLYSEQPLAWKSAFAAGDALHDEACVLIDQNCHFDLPHCLMPTQCATCCQCCTAAAH